MKAHTSGNNAIQSAAVGMNIGVSSGAHKDHTRRRLEGLYLTLSRLVMTASEPLTRPFRSKKISEAVKRLGSSCAVCSPATVLRFVQ